ncbi:MAG: pyridoxamine 5'-phosphate oxidase family protein [Candidatus Odinarchaeota archaeon]
MEDNIIREMCFNLLDVGWPAYVTTIDREGFPQTRAMFNLRNKERFPKLVSFFEQQEHDFTLIFTTNTSSTKIEDIGANKRVSVYYCDPETWRGVMFSGLIEIVTDSNIKKSIWQPEWSKYYISGYDDPDHTVLRLIPTMAKGWTGNQTFRLELR